MGFKMPPIFAIVAIVCAAVGLLFQIIGVATEGWMTVEILGSSTGYGLWSDCPNDKCEDWMNAVRAFGIIGLLVLAGCLVVGILMCFMDNDKFSLIGAILGFVAAFCILIEFAVYADHTTTNDFVKYGYSFALTIVAFLLAIAAGVFFLLAKFKS